MAYAKIPAGKMQSQFLDLQDADLNDTKLLKAVFYDEDLEVVKNQAEKGNNNPKHLGFTFGFATIVEPSGEKKNCLVAYSVTKQFDSSDGDWETRRDDAGDYVALSCPRYEIPGEQVIV